MEPLRVAFVGAGGIAFRHLQALEEIGDVEVVAVTNPSPEKAQALAEKCGPSAKVYTDYRQILANEELDALYIFVPPAAHGELEQSAIDRNLPFFIEKPLSADADTAEKIFKGVQAKNLVTSVGYQWRYLNTTEMAQSLMAKQPAHLAQGYWLGSLPSPPWWSVTAQSGGQMVEQTTHVIDLARLLVGEVKQVFAVGQRLASDEGIRDIDRVAAATVEFESGAVGTFSTTSLLNGLFRGGIELFGEGQSLGLYYHELVIDDGKGGRQVEKVTVDPFVRENRDFLEAVRGQPNQIRSDYAEGLRTHRLAHAIARSAREKRPVDLKPL